MTTDTMTAKQLLDDIRSGAITVTPDDDILRVPPGATFADNTAYPDTVLRLYRGEDEVMALPVWGCGGWQNSNLKSGELCPTGYDDGCFSGSVHCQVGIEKMPAWQYSQLGTDDPGTILIRGGDHITDAIYEFPAGVDEDAAYQLADELEEAINLALPPVALPSDAEELEWLRAGTCYNFLTVDADGDIRVSAIEPDAPFVPIYKGESLDRIIYAVGEDHENNEYADRLFDDEERDAVEQAAKKLLVKLLEKAIAELEDGTFSPSF